MTLFCHALTHSIDRLCFGSVCGTFGLATPVNNSTGCTVFFFWLLKAFVVLTSALTDMCSHGMGMMMMGETSGLANVAQVVIVFVSVSVFLCIWPSWPAYIV